MNRMLAPAGQGFAGKMALFSLLVLCLLGTATESRSINMGRPPLILRVQRLRGGSEDMGESGHGDMDDLDGGGGDQEDAAWRRVPREEQATASAAEDMVQIGRHIAIVEELVSPSLVLSPFSSPFSLSIYPSNPLVRIFPRECHSTLLSPCHQPPRPS
jgi:hypothetical protein